jgi:hypothetical protein
MSQETASVLGNSYRIYSYRIYIRNSYRIYSLLVPGILESRMSQETASVLGNSYRIYSLKWPLWSCKVLFPCIPGRDRLPMKRPGG